MIYPRACSKLYFIADRVESVAAASYVASVKRRKCRHKNIPVIIRRLSFSAGSRAKRVPESLRKHIAPSVFSLPHPIPGWNSIKAGPRTRVAARVAQHRQRLPYNLLLSFSDGI